MYSSECMGSEPTPVLEEEDIKGGIVMKVIMDQEASNMLKEDVEYLEKLLRRSLEGQTSKWDNMQVVIQFRENASYNEYKT